MTAADLTEESGPTPDAVEEPGLSADVTEAIQAAVRAELDEVVPHVLEALRRNNAFDEINERLRFAERRIEARQERPVIVSVHSVLDRMRHLDFDEEIKQALEDDIVRVLTAAGFEETGLVGESYDPSRHDAIDGRAVDGVAVVARVHTRGLVSFGDVVIRAKVEISPSGDTGTAA